MTNHIHLLVTPNKQDSVSLMMQYIGRHYVPYINYTYGTNGLRVPPPLIINRIDTVQIREDLEKAAIAQALREEGGNQSRAAARLGISERALRYKLSKYRKD